MQEQPRLNFDSTNWHSNKLVVPNVNNVHKLECFFSKEGFQLGTCGAISPLQDIKIARRKHMNVVRRDDDVGVERLRNYCYQRHLGLLQISQKALSKSINNVCDRVIARIDGPLHWLVEDFVGRFSLHFDGRDWLKETSHKAKSRTPNSPKFHKVSCSCSRTDLSK